MSETGGPLSRIGLRPGPDALDDPTSGTRSGPSAPLESAPLLTRLGRRPFPSYSPDRDQAPCFWPCFLPLSLFLPVVVGNWLCATCRGKAPCSCRPGEQRQEGPYQHPRVQGM